MKQPKYKYWRAIHNGHKVPRKAKKYFLGNKISGNELRRLLKTVTIKLYKDPHRPSYPIIKFIPYAFCPKCGCTEHRGVYRPGYYPEVWNSYYCLRCGYQVAYEDNSPYTHVLEEYLIDEYEKQYADKKNMPVYEYPEYSFTLDDFIKDL
jgi:hypothetical protein